MSAPDAALPDPTDPAPGPCLAPALAALWREVRGCTLCAQELPLGPRPVLRPSSRARVLIVGQAPGIRVHRTGVPWNDPSGERLRAWLGLDRAQFYDPERLAIMPMGFCYPGRAVRGDRPPPPRCAARWHAPLLAAMPQLELIVLIGRYAQRGFLGAAAKPSTGATVAAWAEYGPRYFPLPHPSPRNHAWLRDRPWFAAEVLPALRARLAALWALAVPNPGVRSAR
jgi:uracil-DNA glycosylase